MGRAPRRTSISARASAARASSAATIAGSSASCSRYAFGNAAKSSDAATPSAASVARNADAPASCERSGAPSWRANHSPARLFQRRSRIPVCHHLRIFVGNELHVERVAHRAEHHRGEHGREEPPMPARFSWITPSSSSPKVTASQVADATVASSQHPVAAGSSTSSRATASVSARSRRAISSAERRSASVCPARNCRRAWLRWNPTIGNERQRGDRGQEHDVRRPMAPVAGQPGDEVRQGRARRTLRTTPCRGRGADSARRARRAASAAARAACQAPARAPPPALRRRRIARRDRARDTGRSPRRALAAARARRASRSAASSVAWRTSSAGRFGDSKGSRPLTAR